MINWGIIGLGRMGNTFADAIKELKDCKLKAISSLNKSKLSTFSKKYNVDQNYIFNSYDRLINCKDIDAIYISTLNNTHKDLIIKSIENQKHVLCEKPITITEEEINDVYEKVKSSKVIFLEAIAYRFHPITKVIYDILSKENSGKIKKIITNYGFDTKKIKPNSRLYDKNLGGGAILDIGCYPLSILNLIKKIENIKSKVIFKNVNGNICETGVDDHAAAEIIFENGITLEIEVGIRKKLENFLLIKTDKGEIKIPDIWHPNKKTYIDIKFNDHYYKKTVACDYSLYSQQINFFNSLIKNTNKTIDFPYLSLEDSKEIAELSLEWRKKLY